jgi:hypothetical protein
MPSQMPLLTMTLLIMLSEIDRCIKYAQWSLELEIYEGLDLQEEIDKLEKMKSEIPDKHPG